jgi:hypothetical protein
MFLLSASVPGFHFLDAVAALDQPHSQLQFGSFERHDQPGTETSTVQYVRGFLRYETCPVPICQPTNCK